MRRTLSNLRITVPTFIHLRATPVFAPFQQFLLSTTGIFSAFPRIGTERAFVYSYQSGRGGIRTHSPNGNGFTVRRSSPTLPPSQRSNAMSLSSQGLCRPYPNPEQSYAVLLVCILPRTQQNTVLMKNIFHDCRYCELASTGRHLFNEGHVSSEYFGILMPHSNVFAFRRVGIVRLELTHLAVPDSKSGASANSTISPYVQLFVRPRREAVACPTMVSVSQTPSS